MSKETKYAFSITTTEYADNGSKLSSKTYASEDSVLSNPEDFDHSITYIESEDDSLQYEIIRDIYNIMVSNFGCHKVNNAFIRVVKNDLYKY